MNRYPLVLPRSDLRRILERHATRLVSTARSKRGTYTVQDAYTIRRNARNRQLGQVDALMDPDVCAVEITAVEPIALEDVGYRLVRACGFHTQRDFFDDWLQRRRHIDPSQTVYTLTFHLIEQPRFLHRRTFAGYTTNPALAARGEPEALGAEDLAHLAAGSSGATRARARRGAAPTAARSLTVRYREALRTSRFDEAIAVAAELGRLAEISA